MNWLPKSAITLVILFIFIVISGTWSGSCASKKRVEEDLLNHSKANLAKGGFENVGVKVNGLIVRLEGFVKSEEEKKRAGEIIKAMKMDDHMLSCGGHTNHPVDNQLKVRSAPASLRWLTQRFDVKKSQDKDTNLAGIQWDAVLVHQNMSKGQNVELAFKGRSEKVSLKLDESSATGAVQQTVRFTVPENCMPCAVAVTSPSVKTLPLELNVQPENPYELRFLKAPDVVAHADDLDRVKEGIQYDLMVEHRGLTPPKTVEIFKLGSQGPVGAALGQGTLKLSSVDKKWKAEPFRVSFTTCPNCRFVAVAKDESGSVMGLPTLIDVKNSETLQVETDIAKLVSLQNVEFQSGSANLTRRGLSTVKKVAGLLLKAKGIGVEIQGHTDSQGKDNVNQTLSEARARTVNKALVNLGVDAQILSQHGFGETKPVASNDTAQGRARNRRIEFVISRR